MSRYSLTCGVCGVANPVTSNHDRGDGEDRLDLEGRPSSLSAASMSTWLAECQACGYAGNEDSLEVSDDRRDDLAELVASEEYAGCGADIPPVARRFLRRAVIAAHSGDERFAGHASLHAAWVCDAEGDERGAVACRGRAIDYWREAHAEGDVLTDDNDPAKDAAVLAETMRRATRFAEAIEEVSAALPRVADTDMKRVLTRILALARARDAASTAATCPGTGYNER